MPATIELKLTDNKIIQSLNDLAAASVTLAPVMREIAGILADASEQAFSDEADPATGQPWKELTEAHKVRRAEKGYTGAILQMVGDLASSIQSDYGKDFAQVGSNKVYAAIHQHGGLPGMPARNAAIPARPFLGASEQDQDEIMAVLERHLSDALNS